MNAAADAAPADVAPRHAVTRDAGMAAPATGDPSRAVGRGDGDVAMWRLRREAAATDRVLLGRRGAEQRALGAPRRAERDDVHATARRLVAAATVLRQAVRVAGPADPARGVPADLPQVPSTLRAAGRARVEAMWGR